MRANVTNFAAREEIVGDLVQLRDVSVFHRNRNHDGEWNGLRLLS